MIQTLNTKDLHLICSQYFFFTYFFFLHNCNPLHVKLQVRQLLYIYVDDLERNRQRSGCFSLVFWISDFKGEYQFLNQLDHSYCETFDVALSSSILVLSFVGRDNNTLEQANRKLERKMKEITMQVNDEQLSLQNQMDQVRARDLTTWSKVGLIS